jgi:hypothetical protein
MQCDNCMSIDETSVQSGIDVSGTHTYDNGIHGKVKKSPFIAPAGSLRTAVARTCGV